MFCLAVSLRDPAPTFMANIVLRTTVPCVYKSSCALDAERGFGGATPEKWGGFKGGSPLLAWKVLEHTQPNPSKPLHASHKPLPTSITSPLIIAMIMLVLYWLAPGSAIFRVGLTLK